MKYGIVFPNVGNFGDARALADLAQVAEEAGWDGMFLWDTVHYIAENRNVVDAWITLAAMATQTQRINIGLQVAAPSRRRPWKMARETVTLDHLSNGRFILGVGVGDVDDKGFRSFGEVIDAKQRASMLDESLAILQGLWSGKPFSFNGEHYSVDEITFLPKPVQTPGIPIWVASTWPKKKPMERAARFDGVMPFGDYTPEEIRQLKRFVDERRTSDTPYDVVIYGPVFEAINNPQARTLLKANAEAGATWSIQSIMPDQNLDHVRTLIRQGPPSLQ